MGLNHDYSRKPIIFFNTLISLNGECKFFDWKTRTVRDTAIEFMGVGVFSYAISVCTVVVHFCMHPPIHVSFIVMKNQCTEMPCLGGEGTNFPYPNKFWQKHPVSL